MWLNSKYGEHGKVTAHRGEIHKYLKMKIELRDKKVKLNMVDYVEKMLEEFSIKFKQDNKVVQPAGNNMFNKDKS